MKKNGLKYAIAQRYRPGTDAERSDPAWLSARRDEQKARFETALAGVRDFCRGALEHEENDPDGWSFDLLKSAQKVLGFACDARRDFAIYNDLLAEATAADRRDSTGDVAEGIAERMDDVRARFEAHAREEARARGDAIRASIGRAAEAAAPHLRVIDGGLPPETRP